MSYYSPHSTPLHRLHPAGKIVLLALFFVWTMLFADMAGALLALGVALAGIAVSRSLRNIRRSLPLLIPLVLMCLLLWGLLTRGTVPLWTLGRLVVYQDSLLYASTFAARLSAMFIAGLVFVSTTGVEELRLGLTRLGLPYPMAFATGLAFRLVPLIGSTLEKAAQAQKSRGLALDRGGLLTRLRNHAPLIIPVILVSLRNIDQLAAALEARGFGRQALRTSFLATPWRAADTMCCVVAVIVIATTIALKYR